MSVCSFSATIAISATDRSHTEGDHLVHQLPQARPEAGTDVVVFGHSHKTLVERRGGVLYVNPGAAGRTGFHRPQTGAVVRVDEGEGVEARIVELGARQALERRAPMRRAAGPNAKTVIRSRMYAAAGVRW